MHFKQREGRGASVLLYVLVLVLLFLTSGVVSFIAFGGLAGLPFLQKAPTAYFASGEAKAMRLAAPDATEEAALREYFAGAVAFAEENGFNTILFEGKTGATVQWRDDVFPHPEGMDAADTRRKKTDPLMLLCEEMGGKAIQLWLAVDPYATGTVPAGSAAKAAGLQEAQAGAAFAADNEAYAELLVESLSALPRRYPLAGLILTGFEGDGGETFTTAFHQTIERLHTGLADTGRLLPLGLAFGDTNSLVSPEYAGALQSEGYITYVLPTVGEGDNVFRRVEAFSRFEKGLIMVEPEDDDGMLLFAASREVKMDGILLARYPEDKDNAGRFALLASAMEAPEGASLPEGFDIPTLLAVNYPAQNARLAYEEVYVMGNSDPAQPLLLDGAEVEARAAGGSFGVAVPLEVGDNSFTFSQGEKSLTLNIERYVPESAGTPEYPPDGTAELPVGSVARVTAVIAGALTSAADDGTMNETLVKGATFTVEDNATTVRSGKTTWAYQMKSGDWVLAQNCEAVAGDGKAHFTGITAEEGEGGEWLNFEGSGSPAAYVARDVEGGRLSLTFWDTTFDLPESFFSRHVSSAAVENLDTGAVSLTLEVGDLWGYSLEYTDTGTRLFLKDTPRRSADPAKPLAGIRIMLDPGHGGDDLGAPGIMGEGSAGPNEKHLNLALAQAIAYRLRQLGAEVLFTREDDTFYELYERLAMQMEQKPDFFLSVHHNSVELNADRSEVMGVESYYFHPYAMPPSGAFAQNLIERVSEGTGRTLRKEAEWTYFYVTRATVCPSVLFEFGFVVNPYEFEDIASAEGLYAAAFAVGDAVLDTLPPVAGY